MRAHRPALAVTVAVLLGSVLPACGGDGASAAEKAISAAPGRTIEEGTSRVAIEVTAPEVSSGAFGGEGEFDFARQHGRLELDLGPLSIPGLGRTEILFSEDVVFMKLPLPQLGNRPWLRIDLDELEELASSGSLANLRQLQTNDPTAALNYLHGVTDDAKKVGTESVRGTSTTRYSATLDLDAAAGQVGDELKDDLARVKEQLRTSQIPTTVWIDGEGRLRRLRYSVELPAAGGQASTSTPTTATATLELYDFGVEVPARTPPPGPGHRAAHPARPVTAPADHRRAGSAHGAVVVDPCAGVVVVAVVVVDAVVHEVVVVHLPAVVVVVGWASAVRGRERTP